MAIDNHKYILYCSKGHGIFLPDKFIEEIPKCPVCGDKLSKMEGVVKK